MKIAYRASFGRSLGASLALALIAAAIASAPLGCAADKAPPDEVMGASVEQPIVNGQPANSYTEAALINTSSYICSGSIIAPRVALTAGHCVDAGSYTVVAPYANNQQATGSQTWTEYQSAGQYVDPDSLDVAVIILDTPINLPWYPPLASAAVASGTQAINVGRIQDGSASYSQLFYGDAVTLSPGTSCGFPLAYCSDEIIQSGDSGGPVYVGAGTSRRSSASTPAPAAAPRSSRASTSRTPRSRTSSRRTAEAAGAAAARPPAVRRREDRPRAVRPPEDRPRRILLRRIVRWRRMQRERGRAQQHVDGGEPSRRQALWRPLDGERRRLVQLEHRWRHPLRSRARDQR